MRLHEEFKLFENMWESWNNEAITESTASNGYRVVLADYESDDFEINVEFGYQDPDEPDVEDMEYLLKPGQTKGDLVVYLSEDCGYTSIYVHDERPATAADIKRLSGSTFPTTGRGDEWSDYGDIDEAKTKEPKEPLTEARSVADIEAEIAKLRQELAAAKAAEKKASYGGKLPKTVWTWDIYLEPAKKGTWTGIENDLVFETEDKALDEAWALLNELDDEGELRGDPDDYYIEAFEIPLSSVSKEVLKYSNLTHLI